LWEQEEAKALHLEAERGPSQARDAESARQAEAVRQSRLARDVQIARQAEAARLAAAARRAGVGRTNGIGQSNEKFGTFMVVSGPTAGAIGSAKPSPREVGPSQPAQSGATRWFRVRYEAAPYVPPPDPDFGEAARS
jgi:hypothetical protein